MPWNNSIIVAVVTLCCMEFARAAIPADADLYTTQQAHMEEFAWQRRSMSEAYLRGGMKNPALDARVVHFLDGTARRYAELDDALALKDLEREGRLLYIDGCDDPMVCRAYGSMLWDLQQWSAAEPFLQTAIAGIGGSSVYPAFCRIGSCHKLYILNMRNGHEQEAAHYFATAVDSVKQTIEASAFSKNDQKILYESIAILFDDEAVLPQLAVLNEWLQTAPKADPWLVQMVGGLYHMKAAWASRGGGWASQVSPAGWEGFSKHLQKAREQFTAAWKLNPNVPHAAANLIRVAMGRSPNALTEMRLWFDRAVAAQFDYKPAYDALEFGLLPRWHGNRELEYQFGVECAQTRRFDTAVPNKLIDILFQIRADDDSTQFWKIRDVYNHVKHVLFSYATQPGQEQMRVSSLTCLAGFAAEAGHWSDAAAALGLLMAPMDALSLKKLGKTEWELAGEIRAHNGQWANDLAEAERLDSAGQSDKALRIYQKLAGRAGQYAEVCDFFKTQVWIREAQKAFQTGDWVDLRFDEHLNGWRPWYGQWTRQSNGSVVGKSSVDGLTLVCLANFGKRFEIRGRFNIVRSPFDETNAGVDLLSPGQFYLHQILVKPFKGTSVIRTAYDDGVERPAPSAQRDNNDFRIQVDRDHVKVWLNDQPLYVDETLERYPAEGYSKIALGGHYWFSNASVLFKNIQIRKLK